MFFIFSRRFSYSFSALVNYLLSNTGVSYLDRLDKAFVIEKHPVDASDAMVGICLTQKSTVIDDIPIISAGNLQDGFAHVLIELTL